jgi:ribose transport system ATP-binding protein
MRLRLGKGQPKRNLRGEVSSPWDASHPKLVLKLDDISKRYGATQALSGVSLELFEGEMLGVIGHNGAGKSTLARAITGLTVPDTGNITIGSDGGDSRRHSAADARQRGCRMVFQELSLCPSLRVFENVPVAYPGLLRGAWRRRCRDLIAGQLEDIFPGHGIQPAARIGTLSLPQRQMVEIAMATLKVDPLPRLLLLDEPTASLTEEWSARLFRYLRACRAEGLACIIISHRVPEIQQHTDAAVVLRDGRVVARRQPSELKVEEVISLMGGEPRSSVAKAPVRRARAMPSPDAPEVVNAQALRSRRLRAVSMVAREGEIIGLGGLEGHGQRDLLHSIWRNRRRRLPWGSSGLRVRGPVAFVSGDRKVEGVFPIWSVAHNLSSSVLGSIARWGLVWPGSEQSLFDVWSERFQIRGAAASGITSLSGGNQQKVLLARALAADARLILLDDPLRGVDVATKHDVYQLLQEEAERGRCFVWFSTENEGLQQCDRVYVMRAGAIVEEMTAAEASDDQLIAASIRAV